MNREQLCRKIKKYCRKHDIPFKWDPGEGKGSHGSVYVNGRRSILQSGELKNFYIYDVLDHLGIPRDAI